MSSNSGNTFVGRIDSDTGEVLHVFEPKEDLRWTREGGFILMNTDVCKLIDAPALGLGYHDVFFLLAMAGAMGYDNQVNKTTREIADIAHANHRHAFDTIKRLTRAGFIARHHTYGRNVVYMVNPSLFMRGNSRRREERIAEFERLKKPRTDGKVVSINQAERK